MNKNPYLFQDLAELQGFRFPELYLKIVSSEKLPPIYPWWFLLKEPEKAKLLFQIINLERRSNKMLIPFAKIDDENGDVACFDGDDNSGNPKIFFSTGTGLLNNIDWEKCYCFDSFSDWLKSVALDEE